MTFSIRLPGALSAAVLAAVAGTLLLGPGPASACNADDPAADDCCGAVAAAPDDGGTADSSDPCCPGGCDHCSLPCCSGSAPAKLVPVTQFVASRAESRALLAPPEPLAPTRLASQDLDPPPRA